MKTEFKTGQVYNSNTYGKVEIIDVTVDYYEQAFYLVRIDGHKQTDIFTYSELFIIINN